MRIEDLRIEEAGSKERAAARVIWEDSDRTDLDLFYETPRSGRLRPAAEPFLAACALPAMRHGERRIRLSETVCPLLAEGVRAAADLLRGWYGPPRVAPSIETAKGFAAPRPRRPAQSALLFSGGVDSLDLLLEDRRLDRRRDRSGFAGAVWVVGDGHSEGQSRLREALGAPVSESGVELCPISTNVKKLDEDLEFFAREFFGAALLSAAHVLAGRFDSIAVASTALAGRVSPWGSHPRLDPLWGSAALRVFHERSGVSRLEKVRAISGWAAGMRALHVCNEDERADRVNCGTCEKCVETMTELTAAGNPGPWPTFPAAGLPPEAILSLPVLQDSAASWADLPGALEAAGRGDLARAVREKLCERDAAARWTSESNWSGPIRRFDRRLLGGRLLAASRRARRRSG